MSAPHPGEPRRRAHRRLVLEVAALKEANHHGLVVQEDRADHGVQWLLPGGLAFAVAAGSDVFNHSAAGSDRSAGATARAPGRLQCGSPHPRNRRMRRWRRPIPLTLTTPAPGGAGAGAGAGHRRGGGAYSGPSTGIAPWQGAARAGRTEGEVGETLQAGAGVLELPPQRAPRLPPPLRERRINVVWPSAVRPQVRSGRRGG